MRYGVLGPVEAVRDGRRVRLGGPKQRLVLALLLLEPGRWRSADRLIDDTWGDAVPERARHTLQVYVSRLRALVDDEIINESSGYRLDVDADSVDAARFERLVGVGRAQLAAADPAAAAETLRDALECWRGEPFGDLAFEPALRPAAVRLSELRAAAVADRVDADLMLGRHTDVVQELDALCREHPFDERFRGLHMRALCGSGRQRDALLVFARTRETFIEELGLEPSAELRQLERLILANDNSLTGTTSPDAPRAVVAVDDAPAAIRGFELRGEVRAEGRVRWLRAYQRVPGREAMLRICDPSLANTGEFVVSFEPSARAAAAVEHPHLLALEDYWRDPSGAFASWRWLPGGALSSLLASGVEPLATHVDPLELLEQIGGALSSLHRRGIAHGDVCVESIQLDLDGRAFLSPPWLGFGDRSPTVDSDIADLGVVALAVLGNRQPRQVVAELSAIVGPGVPEHGDDRAATVEDLLAVVRRSLGTGTAPPAPPVVDAPTAPFGELRNPYKGLRAFQELDAADFFGRDRLTEQLIDSLRRNRLVAVVGPSGIGKSSAVRAGLLPAVRRGVLGDERWLVTDMYPGHAPFDELASALLRVAVKRPDDLDAELTADDQGLARVAAAVLPAGYSLLLVVDQFEELFSMVSDQARRLAFIGSLVAAVRGEHSRVRIVLTMRADFFDQPLELHELGELIRSGLVTVAFPSDDDLELSVTQPARCAGLELEPGLVTEIVRDVRNQPGGLPLLQHALTELVDRRHGRQLTTDGYRASGGVLGALSRRAEEVYLSLDERRRDAAEQLFLRLVNVGEVRGGSRARVTYSDLTSLGIDVSTIDDVVGRFGAHRLVTFDRDPVTRGPTVEIAHEALFSAWMRLAGWIEARRDDLRLRRRLGLAADEWTEAAKDHSFLLGGARLEQLGRWADATTLRLTSAELDFLETSRRQEATLRRSRQRGRRIALVALGVITLVSLVFALVATVERRRADRSATTADAEALHAEAGRLATRSSQQIPERLDVALLLAVEAHHRDPSAETASALWNALSAAVPSGPVRYGVLGGFIFPDVETLRAVDVDADGSLAAFGGAAGGGGRIVAMETADRRAIATLDTGAEISALTILDDGSIVYAAGDGSLARWTTTDPRLAPVTLRAPGGDPIVSLDAHPDDLVIATASRRGEIALWDLTATAEPLPIGDPLGTPGAVRFSPTGVLATTANDGAAQLWDPATGERVGPTLEPQVPGLPLTLLAFAADGGRLAGAPVDGTITVWSTDDPAQPALWTSIARTAPRALAFAASPSADVLAIASHSGELLIADANAGSATPVARPGWGAADTTLAFAGDGSLLVTGAGTGRAALWTATSGPTPMSSPIGDDWVAARTGAGDGSLAVGWVRGDDLHIRRAEIVELGTGRAVATIEASGAACCIWDARLDATGSHAVVSAAVHEDLTGQSFTFVDVRSGEVTGQVTVDDRVIDYFPYDLSPEGESVAVVTPERVEIWHRTRGLVATLEREGGDIATAVAFVGDAELAVAFAGLRPRLAVFDTGSWRLDRELAVPGAIRSLAVDPLGQILVGGGQDGMLARWQLPDWEVLPTWSAGVGTIVELAVATDGSVLATGLSSAVALLDPTGNAIGIPMALDSSIRPLSFADDGSTALISTATGVRRFELDPLAWEQTACVLAGRALDEREWADHVGDEPYRPVCSG